MQKKRVKVRGDGDSVKQMTSREMGSRDWRPGTTMAAQWGTGVLENRKLMDTGVGADVVGCGVRER